MVSQRIKFTLSMTAGLLALAACKSPYGSSRYGDMAAAGAQSGYYSQGAYYGQGGCMQAPCPAAVGVTQSAYGGVMYDQSGQPVYGGYGFSSSETVVGKPAIWEQSPSVNAVPGGSMGGSYTMPPNTSCTASAAACAYITETYNMPSYETVTTSTYSSAAVVECPAGSIRSADGNCQLIESPSYEMPSYSTPQYVPSYPVPSTPPPDYRPYRK